MVRKRDPYDKQPLPIYHARVNTKLNLRTAAALLGLTAKELSDMEWGRAVIPNQVKEEMEKLYVP